MPPIAYGFVLAIGLYSLLALQLGGLWTIGLPIFAFVMIPLAEHLSTGSKHNASKDQEQALRGRRGYDFMLYAIVPVQVAVVISLMANASGYTPWEMVGATVTAGICCGGLGINVAHELGHRSAPGERRMAKVLLLTTLYQHFFIEHNRGHHARVATYDDPASARLGETLYGFWARSIPGGVRSAWRLEVKRLSKRDAVWSWDNEMLRFGLLQGGALVTAALVFGPLAAGLWVIASLGGVLLLETVNYLEHYGLSRERQPDGRYERVRPAHSWTSNRPIGRVLLFELTRHADHHAHPARPYPVLRHFDDAPELPSGYPAMIVVALIPPLFFHLMNRQLAQETRRLEALAAFILTG